MLDVCHRSRATRFGVQRDSNCDLSAPHRSVMVDDKGISDKYSCSRGYLLPSDPGLPKQCVRKPYFTYAFRCQPMKKKKIKKLTNALRASRLYWLNFDIFLTTFWVTLRRLLFEQKNLNIRTVKGGDVKLSNPPITLLGIFPCFDWPK